MTVVTKTPNNALQVASRLPRIQPHLNAGVKPVNVYIRM